MCSSALSPPKHNPKKDRRRRQRPRRRRSKKTVPNNHNMTDHLPSDLLVEILSHVASNSVADLFSFKQTCRLMSESGTQRCVLRNAAVLHNFLDRGGHRFDPRYRSFMDKCTESDNPEALFCQGLEEYFYGLRAAGMGSLKAAAEKGSKEARYACGIISLIGREGQGLELLKGLRRKEWVKECRKTVKAVMRSNKWINYDGDRMRLEKKNDGVLGCGCDRRRSGRRVGDFSEHPDFGWLTEKEQAMEVVESGLCDSCFWQFEACVFEQLIGT